MGTAAAAAHPGAESADGMAASPQGSSASRGSGRGAAAWRAAGSEQNPPGRSRRRSQTGRRCRSLCGGGGRDAPRPPTQQPRSLSSASGGRGTRWRRRQPRPRTRGRRRPGIWARPRRRSVLSSATSACLPPRAWAIPDQATT